MRKNKGFTLIELMIAVVVFGVLVAIAYPSYTTFILKSRRTDAQASIGQDQTIFERCYAQNFSYSATCAALPTNPHASNQGYYSIAFSNLTASTYTITATPVGGQLKDTTCASFVVNQTNLKTATNTGGVSQPVCWNSN